MRTIHHVLDIGAPVGTVWGALTEHDGLAGWWGTTLSAGAATPGALIRFTFGGGFNPVMEITDLVDQQQVRWRCIDGHANWHDNTFVVELVPLEKVRSRLRLTQELRSRAQRRRLRDLQLQLGLLPRRPSAPVRHRHGQAIHASPTVRDSLEQRREAIQPVRLAS
jgi:uncharacterized protein YndB with AHSA1/START domain